MIIALATFTGAVKNLLSLIEWNRPEAARTELAQLSLDNTPDVFIQKVKKGDTHAVRLFLKSGMDPNAKDRNGMTALMHAALTGDIPIIELLLDSKANVNERIGIKGNTALSSAVAGKNEEIVHILLDRGADARAINRAFVTAAAKGSLGMLRIMLDKGADVKMVGSEALFRAAELGSSDAVQFLLDLGVVGPNAKRGDGWTVLTWASHRGSASVVQTLLDRGADINAKCECPLYKGGGWTALMLAIGNRHNWIAEALLSEGADVNTRNHEGQTPLSLAINNGDEVLVQALRDKGAQGMGEVIEGGLSKEKIKAMLIRNDFYHTEWNARGKGIAHDYEPRAIGDAVVVMDHAISLMWQKGVSESMTPAKAEDYIVRLNAERYAGFSDWRIPTLKEAMSLMEPQAYREYHISPVFERGVTVIWTANRKPNGKVWVVDFYNGSLGSYGHTSSWDVLAVRWIGSVANE